MSDHRKRTRIRPAVEGVGGEERPDPVLESADDRRIETAGVAAVEPPDRPLVGGRVERAQRDRPVGAGRQLEDVVVDVAGAVEERPRAGRALEFVPLVAAREALAAAGGGGPARSPCRSRSRGRPGRPRPRPGRSRWRSSSSSSVSFGIGFESVVPPIPARTCQETRRPPTGGIAVELEHPFYTVACVPSIATSRAGPP